MLNLSLKTLRQLLIAFAAAIASATGHTQQWPDKPVRIVVPAPPGGALDAVARLLGEQLRASLGQNFVVDNKPGGSGTVAEQAVMNAPPDGYTLMLAPSSIASEIPLTVKKPYDVLKVFNYVAEASRTAYVLAANTSLPANNVSELLDYAKRTPGKTSVAILANGTRSHFLGATLNQKSGNDILLIPYKGSAPAMVDLLGNQIQLSFDVVSNVIPHLKSGKLKAIAISSPARSQHLPNVPSFAEQGQADFVFADASTGIWVPVGLTKPVADRILSEVSKAVHSSKFREGLTAQGFELPQDGNADQLRQQLVIDLARNKAIIERLKLNVNPE